MTYICDFDTNFQDKEAFITGISRYMEEAGIHQQLNLVLEEGEDYACMLYTWRLVLFYSVTFKSCFSKNLLLLSLYVRDQGVKGTGFVLVF